jgi:hypothetical protein
MDLGGVVAHVAFRESITSAFLGGEGNARRFAFLLHRNGGASVCAQ